MGSRPELSRHRTAARAYFSGGSPSKRFAGLQPTAPTRGASRSRLWLAATATVCAVVGLAGLHGQTSSRAAEILPCAGAPRPVEPAPPCTQTYVLFEGEPVPSFLGVNCLALDETLSGVTVDWRDGTTSQGAVEYKPNSDGTPRQAWIRAHHRYLRARCRSGQDRSGQGCRPYSVTTTAIDDRSGASLVLNGRVKVIPGLLFPSRVRLRGRKGIPFRGRLTRVRSTGLRLPGELTARVRWGDGTRSRARVVGSERRFVVVVPAPMASVRPPPRDRRDQRPLPGHRPSG
jgi:hypothetical protein